MEFLILACSSTLQVPIIEFLEKRDVYSYTCIPNVLGSGVGGGTRLNDEIWPGNNVVFLLALPKETAEDLKEWARTYRKRAIREGLKIFHLEMKDMI